MATDTGALAAREGLGILDRGPAVAERRRVERLTIVRAKPLMRPRGRRARTASILIIEDDPEVREHLELFVREEGYDVATAVDGPAALELAARRTIRPDLVLADYNLPNGMNGIQVCQKLRQELGRQIPFIILTGDISTEALRDIAASRLRPVQQTRQVERVDPRHREAFGEAACRARAARGSPG